MTKTLLDPMERLTSGEPHVVAATAREFAERVRTVVSYSNSPGARPGPPQVASLPDRGRRVLPLCRVVPQDDTELVSAEETSPRSEVAAATPYETALPEGSLAYAATSLTPAKRVGVWIPAWRSVLEDSRVLRRVVDDLLDLEWSRVADHALFHGTGTGEEVLGLLNNGDIASQALAADTRVDNLLHGAEAVRVGDWVRPLDVAIHPTALFKLVTETDANGQPTLRRDVLDAFGIRGFVPTTLLPTTDALVGDFRSAVTVWIRDPGLTIEARRDHADFFLAGKVAIAAEARWEVRTAMPSALVRLTGL